MALLFSQKFYFSSTKPRSRFRHLPLMPLAAKSGQFHFHLFSLTSSNLCGVVGVVGQMTNCCSSKNVFRRKRRNCFCAARFDNVLTSQCFVFVFVTFINNKHKFENYLRHTSCSINVVTIDVVTQCVTNTSSQELTFRHLDDFNW